MEKWQGSVVIGMPDLGGVMDVIASLCGTENLLFALMDEPDEVYVTTGEVAPPEDTGEEGQEGSTGKEDVSGQEGSTGKEGVSGQEGSTRKEEPVEVELTGDVAYVEEEFAP